MKKIVIALLLAGIALATAGCTGFSNDSLSGTNSRQAVGDTDEAWGGLTAEKASFAPAAVPTPAMTGDGHGSTGSTQTKIIRTAQVTLEVNDVTASADALKTLAAQNGGYLSSSDIRRGYNNRLFATLILRIPQSAFDSVVEGVKAQGTVKSISTQGEDVTEEYIDLQAQKTSYQNQLAQYNEIMKKAVKVEDVIKVQEQIDRVQTALDRLEGRIRFLNSRIDLSTITIELQEPEPVGGQTGHSFVSAINEGIAGFFGMIDGIIILCFTLLPLVLVAGAGYGIYRWRKGVRKTEPAAPSESSEKK